MHAVDFGRSSDFIENYFLFAHRKNCTSLHVKYMKDTGRRTELEQDRSAAVRWSAAAASKED